MIITLIICTLMAASAVLCLRAYGFKYSLASAPVLLNLFIILYALLGPYLFYNGEYYFMGADYEKSLDSIYDLICVFSIVFTFSFILSVRFSSVKIYADSSPVVSSQFIKYYSVILCLFASLSLAGWGIRQLALYNMIMLLFNSLIPIIGYALLKKVKHSLIMMFVFVAISIYFGFRYRLVLLFVPLMLFVFLTSYIGPKRLLLMTGAFFFATILIATVGIARVYSSGLNLSALDGLSFRDLIVRGIFNDTSTILISGAVVEYIGRTDAYAYFNQLYYIAVYFIPSRFLDAKEYSPIFDYVSTATGQGANESGAAVLGFVEYYHTAGYAGVLFFAILLALVAGRLYKKARFSKGIELFIYATFVAWLINSLTRGYFPQNTQDLLSLVIGVKLITMGIASKRVKFF